MNQIQHLTFTVISKFGTLPEKPVIDSSDVTSSSATKDTKVEVKPNEDAKGRRRRSASDSSNDSSDDSESSSDDSSSSDSQDSDDDSIDSSHFQDTVEAPIDLKTEEAASKKFEQEFVIFRISGSAMENVNMAYEYLERIEKGDRMKDVVELLKNASKSLSKRDNSSSYSSRREKGEKEKSTKNSNKKPERKLEEKPSEREGTWKRGEKQDTSNGSKPERDGNRKDRREKTPYSGEKHSTIDKTEHRPHRENINENHRDSSKDFTKPEKNGKLSENSKPATASEGKSKPSMGRFEKRVSGPPSKPYSSSEGSKGKTISENKKPDKSQGPPAHHHAPREKPSSSAESKKPTTSSTSG